MKASTKASVGSLKRPAQGLKALASAWEAEGAEEEEVDDAGAEEGAEKGPEDGGEDEKEAGSVG